MISSFLQRKRHQSRQDREKDPTPKGGEQRTRDDNADGPGMPGEGDANTSINELGVGKGMRDRSRNRRRKKKQKRNERRHLEIPEAARPRKLMGGRGHTKGGKKKPTRKYYHPMQLRRFSSNWGGSRVVRPKGTENARQPSSEEGNGGGGKRSKAN